MVVHFLSTCKFFHTTTYQIQYTLTFRLDHQCGQIVIAVGFFRPEFVLSQSHIKGDHQCGQTTIPDYGHFFVVKRQIQSRIAVKWVFSIYRYDHFDRVFLY